MGAIITAAGESLIAQKHVSREPLEVQRFIFANVPGLDTSGPVDRTAGIPAAGQIVYTAEIPDDNAGYVNPNQVVYSLQIGSDVGDWDFNWIGLQTAEGTLFAVAYVPAQQKRKNIPPLQVGNNITRNFLLAFDGAQALTGITIDASTWQHDFTARLAGIDERERLSNRDVFGRATFFGSSLQVEKVGSSFLVKPGTAYIEGIRLQLTSGQAVVPAGFPTTAWLDVALQREMSDVLASYQVVFAADRPDYIDSAGVKHYCVALADIAADASVTDRRSVEAIDNALVTHFAARVGDYPNLRARATTKTDVGLSNIPNSISDDADTNSGVILATTKAVKTAATLIWTAIENIVTGVTTVGKAAKLATGRKITVNGAVTGNVTFDGSADVSLTTTIAAASESVTGGVKRSTDSQVLTGVDDTAYVTPKKLRLGVSWLFAESGYVALPSWMGGPIIQWGYGIEGDGASDLKYFPVAFPTAVLAMVATPNFKHNVGVWVVVPDRARYFLGMADDYVNATAPSRIFWIALGY